jgi:hypothetical protein
MSRGKHLSLEEARKKKGGLDRFAKEHPSVGDESQFDAIMRVLASRTPPAKDQTSGEARGEGCAETQTPKGTSEDV